MDISGRALFSPTPLSRQDDEGVTSGESRSHLDCLHAEIVEVEIVVVSPSLVPSGNFADLNRTVTCIVLKANDRRTSCPCHDEFRGPRSDYVRQDEVEKLAYQLNEEAERTERPIRRLSKVMYGSTCADMQVDVMGECLSSIKHVVGTTSGCFYPRSNHWEDEEGRSVTNVAAEFRIAHSIISRLWRQFQTTGTAIRGFSSGRPRGTTPADDRYIVLQARRNRRKTAGEIARHTTQVTGRPISRFTVARRLHGGGLFARRPVRCVLLTPAHRRRRSLWCLEHRNWRDNEWSEYSLQMRADSV
ncbi:transposable element Tcb1 transposase [Trichonephila clavipes]|nr:transposable element Tcb1 transposase [Trichonephila clavipes]